MLPENVCQEKVLVNYSIDTNDFTALQGYIIGIAMACPMGCELESCQLNGMRKLPVKTRIQRVKELSHSELVLIYLGHRECLVRRGG